MIRICYKVMGFAIFIFLNIIQLYCKGECAECQNWDELHPNWIFCDDFESSLPLIGEYRYFEYGDNGGDFILLDTVGLNNSKGMRTLWQIGEVGAGGLKLGFGRNPSGYMNRGIHENEDFREIYYRMYLKMQKGWEGNPAKLSRATVFHNQNWAQAMIAHVWSDSEGHLLIDPASLVDEFGNVKSTKYNDFENMKWLGYQSGTTAIFNAGFDDRWYCIEAHVKLNDPGEQNGIQEFWIDGKLEAIRDNLNFVGTYTDYAINAIFFENYWNSGSPKEQERYFDNIVVSKERIGCSCEKLEIDTNELPDGEINNDYLSSINAVGGFSPYQWSIVSGSLPDGINLDSETGTISGIPTVSGKFTFLIQISDSDSPQNITEMEKSIFINEITGIEQEKSNSSNFSNIQPNPFFSSTTIKYYLDEPVLVNIEIYNSLGYKITTLVKEYQDAGSHSVVFTADNLPSGVYYYRIQCDEWTKSGVIVLIK